MQEVSYAGSAAGRDSEADTTFLPPVSCSYASKVRCPVHVSSATAS